MRIGIFDSGIGGSTIAKAVIQSLPHYEYVYYADDSNMPYGDKDAQLLYTLTTLSLRKLFDRDCNIVILACNTATTVLPRIQQHWLPQTYPERKVLGIIRPTVEHMVKADDNQSIYVLGTARTVESQSFDHELIKIGKSCDFHEVSCPALAYAIENSKDIGHDSNIANLCAQYLQTIPDDRHLYIYLGCTHFAFVSSIIQALRPLAKIMDQGPIVSTSFVQYLDRHVEIRNRLTKNDKGSLEVSSSSNNKEYINKVKNLIG